jgi:hypothetical protein
MQTFPAQTLQNCGAFFGFAAYKVGRLNLARCLQWKILVAPQFDCWRLAELHGAELKSGTRLAAENS